MARHALTWEKYTLCPCAFHFSSARVMGAEIPAEGPPPWETLPCEPAAWSPAPGSPGLSAPPCRLCTVTASSCRAARKVPGNLRAPAAAGTSLAALPHRGPTAPPAAGGGARRGLESFDYLIAADTKPIFPPLSILSIVTTFLFRPQLQRVPEPAASVFESQPTK